MFSHTCCGRLVRVWLLYAPSDAIAQQAVQPTEITSTVLLDYLMGALLMYERFSTRRQEHLPPGKQCSAFDLQGFEMGDGAFGSIAAWRRIFIAALLIL